MANYDVATRTITDTYRPEGDVSEVARSGMFGTLGEERLIVLAQGAADMSIGFERGPSIPLEAAQVDWKRGDDGWTEFALSHGDYRHEVRYRVQEIENEVDIYGARLEDFDFGLWVLNIQNSPERRNILLSKWTGG